MEWNCGRTAFPSRDAPQRHGLAPSALASGPEANVDNAVQVVVAFDFPLDTEIGERRMGGGDISSHCRNGTETQVHPGNRGEKRTHSSYPFIQNGSGVSVPASTIRAEEISPETA